MDNKQRETSEISSLPFCKHHGQQVRPTGLTGLISELRWCAMCGALKPDGSEEWVLAKQEQAWRGQAVSTTILAPPSKHDADIRDYADLIELRTWTHVVYAARSCKDALSLEKYAHDQIKKLQERNHKVSNLPRPKA